MTFSEFWPSYLAAHRRPATRFVHLLATLAWLGLLVAAVATRTWWLLALIPVVAYGLAWFSHFFIERNRPATFKYPLLSLLADHRMAFYTLTGRMNRELERLDISPSQRL
ncbi:MAG: Mpo1-like protein [Terriglobia bacterium]